MKNTIYNFIGSAFIGGLLGYAIYVNLMTGL